MGGPAQKKQGPKSSSRVGPPSISKPASSQENYFNFFLELILDLGYCGRLTKGVKMGLDQYAGLRDSKGEVHEKFYWRKHARLQVFMSKQFNKQKKDQDHNTHDDLQHLGFNGGQGGVTITEDLIKDLEEAIKNDYYYYFASDGFFWGQQFQEEQVKEYKAQDQKFLEWAKEQVKAGRSIGYDCSW